MKIACVTAVIVAQCLLFSARHKYWVGEFTVVLVIFVQRAWKVCENMLFIMLRLSDETGKWKHPFVSEPHFYGHQFVMEDEKQCDSFNQLAGGKLVLLSGIGDEKILLSTVLIHIGQIMASGKLSTKHFSGEQSNNKWLTIRCKTTSPNTK